MAITMGAVTIRAVPGAAARAKRAAFVVAIALVGAFVAPYAMASGTDTPAAVHADTWTVASGETLWSIASAITEPGDSVRDTVDDIKALNALESSAIAAGQQLLIPSLD